MRSGTNRDFGAPGRMSALGDLGLCTQAVRLLGLRGMWRLLCDRLLSFNHVFILQRSLSAVAVPNYHRMQWSISKTDEKDWDDILRRATRLDMESSREILARALFFRRNLRNCFAVRSKTGSMAHIQWIVFPEENEAIAAGYRGLFEPLASYETMIENAFTFPEFRGLGLFTYATNHLLNLAGQRGYKKAITYVRCEKFVSLNELIRLGFSIKKVVREYKILGLARRAFDGRGPVPGCK